MDKDLSLNQKEAVTGTGSKLFSWKNVIVFLVFVTPLIVGLIGEINQGSTESAFFIFLANPALVAVLMLMLKFMPNIISNPWSALLLLSFLNALMLFLIISFVSKFRFTMLYVIGTLIGVIIIAIFVIYGLAVGIKLAAWN